MQISLGFQALHQDRERRKDRWIAKVFETGSAACPVAQLVRVKRTKTAERFRIPRDLYSAEAGIVFVPPERAKHPFFLSQPSLLASVLKSR
jgi:hypothetical protein